MTGWPGTRPVAYNKLDARDIPSPLLKQHICLNKVVLLVKENGRVFLSADFFQSELRHSDPGSEMTFNDGACKSTNMHVAPNGRMPSRLGPHARISTLFSKEFLP